MIELFDFFKKVNRFIKKLIYLSQELADKASF